MDDPHDKPKAKIAHEEGLSQAELAAASRVPFPEDLTGRPPPPPTLLDQIFVVLRLLGTIALVFAIVVFLGMSLDRCFEHWSIEEQQSLAWWILLIVGPGWLGLRWLLRLGR